MTDHLTPKRRSENMAAVRSKETQPELTVRRMLHGLGYRYRLHDTSLPGKPDIVFRSRKKIVFIHGCFWHRHPECKYATSPKTNIGFWNEKFEKNVRRDKLVQSQLLVMGWESLIIWQCELKNPELLVHKVVEFLM
ncbi:very short patch repair endonuclease [Chitinophaga sp. S165]|uniref:very short patch repair endonuclease n=1 Tax=Chitinophaga sp. S165 TaxID=2135462 RepID=UPI000D715F33|nr:T/G mismatch-specific endonuclease [Chitinophaga sp. S165]